MWMSARGRTRVVVVTGIAAVAAGAVAAATVRAAPASDPRAHDSPASLQTRAASAPYLSRASAEATALSFASAMGPGQRVLSAGMTTVGAVRLMTGMGVASSGIRASRLVWLIWMRGTYRLFSCIEANRCGVKPHTIYWLAIDARTGASYGFCWSRRYPAGPAR